MGSLCAGITITFGAGAVANVVLNAALIPRWGLEGAAVRVDDLSGYAGRPLDREVLRAATAAVMADITGLLAQLRGEPAPAVPFDPAAARRARAKPGGQTEPPGDGQSRKAAPA